MWSSPLLLSLKAFPLEPCLHSNNSELKRGCWVYLHCILAEWTRNSNWCFVWDWNRRAYGTPSSAMQYSKRSYIIHLLFPLFLRSHPQSVTVWLFLIWQACEAGVQNHDGLALQLLVGRVDIGMIMRHSFQKNGWINNQSLVWEE